MKLHIKHILVILTALFVAFYSNSKNKGSISYVLRHEGDRIAVDMTINNHGQDTIVLKYGDRNAGGMPDIITWLKDLKIKGASCKIDSTNVEFVLTKAKKKVSISYCVKNTLPADYAPKSTCLYDMFRPDITGDMMYVNGFNLFILPKDDALRSAPASVKWQKLPPYPAFCLYNPGGGLQDFHGIANDLDGTVIVGDPLLVVDKVTTGTATNYIVTAARKHPEHNRAAIRDFFNRVYPTMRSFWNDTTTRPYTLILFPFRNNTFKTSGNGLNGGFCSRYDATADTILDLDRMTLFTHEIGHNWVGDYSNMWFGEGFNDLQTIYTMVETKLAPPSFIVDYVNDYIQKLYHSKLRNITKQESDENFWNRSNRDYSWIPYWRGMLYGFYLCGLIEQSTGSKQPYHDMMHALSDYKSHMIPEKFLEIMSTFISRERLEKDFNDCVINGCDIPFSNGELLSGLTVTYGDNGIPKIEISDTDAFRRHWEK